MPNVRNTIGIPPDEQRRMLESCKSLQVASIGPDGRPHLVTMWYALDEEGLIVFSTYYKSQKVRNLERDPRITVLVEDGDTYDTLRGIAIDGDAEIVAGDPEYTSRIMALVTARYGGRGRPAPAPTDPRASKRCIIRVHPVRVRSWDHGRIPGGYGAAQSG